MTTIDELSGVRGYGGFPLTGSPVGQLQDATARRLAAGLFVRCPHPDQPAFCYLPAGVLGCAACTGHLVTATGEPTACVLCGGPAAAVTAWVTGGIPCVAVLCERCHGSGLVPLTRN
ncbi:MAG TPA: hypothetical protein VIX86_04305 [Streptosporangiaceae bacterium]